MYIALEKRGKKKLYTQMIERNVYRVDVNIEQMMAEGVDLGAIFICVSFKPYDCKQWSILV